MKKTIKITSIRKPILMGRKLAEGEIVDMDSDTADFFIKNKSVTGQILAIDSGQSLNWQTPDIVSIKE